MDFLLLLTTAPTGEGCNWSSSQKRPKIATFRKRSPYPICTSTGVLSRMDLDDNERTLSLAGEAFASGKRRVDKIRHVRIP
jgi:hypothetical protein